MNHAGRKNRIAVLGVLAALALPAAAHAAPVTGDFDGDGKADLAVDAEQENVSGQPGAGAVQVLYGSRHGPSGARDRIFTEDTPGVPQSAGNNDDFGAVLATGRFNRDRFADLAVGSPFKDLGVSSTRGTVTILYGSRHGLRARGSKLFVDGEHGLPEPTGPDYTFGFSLAAADLGRSGQDDLAIGISGATVGTANFAGAVDVVYGGRKGLQGRRSRRLTQDTRHVQDQAEQNDEFGFSLAAADFGHDAHADLAVGTVGEGVGASPNAGAVNVLYGSRRGIVARGNRFFTEDTAGVPDSAESGDSFGYSLAAADFGRNRRSDLAIGARGESVDTAPNAGAATLFYGSGAGLRAAHSQFLTQDSLQVGDGSQSEDEFGYALAGANFGHGRRADLAAGAPFDCVGPGMCAEGGAVDVVYGARHGLASGSARGFSQATPGIQGAPVANDYFGSAVTAGRFRGKVNDLAIGIPGEGGDFTGAVEVLRGSTGGITTAHALFLTQGDRGLEGTAEPHDEFGAQLSGPKSTVPFD